jgi:hypothetical protein
VNFTAEGKQKTINLNQDGFVTGTIIEENIGTTTERNFNSKGVITKYVERGSASGNVLNFIDFDAELLQVADDYLSNRKSLTDLKELSIKLDTLQGIADVAGFMFDDDYFYLPGIDGDKTITRNGNERIHGKGLQFERIKFIPYKEHSRWPTKNSDYYNTKAQIKSYNDFLTFYGSEISKQDYGTIQQLIKEAENELISEANLEAAQKQYVALYSKLNEKLKVKPKASRIDGIEPFSVTTHVFSRNTKSTLSKYAVNATNLYFACKYSKNDFARQGYKWNENDYVASTGYAQIRTSHNPQFLFQLLHTVEFVNNVIERCTGTGYPAINSTDLSNIEVKMPSVNEQTKIANFLSSIDEKINHTENQIQQTGQYKKGLLQIMFV